MRSAQPCNCDETVGFDQKDPTNPLAVCRKCGHAWPVNGGAERLRAPAPLAPCELCGRPWEYTGCPPPGPETVHVCAAPLRILCDVDGVLADFVGLVLDYVQRNTGMSVQREAIDRWDCFAAVGLSDHWPYFREQCDGLELCRKMPALSGAAEFYAELSRLGTVRVCTTPMTVSWLSQRAAWLVEFGVPLSEQLHMHDKSDLTRSACGAFGFDVLIDDRVENCEAFVRAGGKAFCISAAYNTHVSACVPRGTHAECLAWVRALAAERVP